MTILARILTGVGLSICLAAVLFGVTTMDPLSVLMFVVGAVLAWLGYDWSEAEK